jgi:hypothetical protein
MIYSLMMLLLAVVPGMQVCVMLWGNGSMSMLWAARSAALMLAAVMAHSFWAKEGSWCCCAC